MTDESRKKPSFFKMALFHPLNYAFLAVAGALSIFQLGDWGLLPLAVIGGLEALWLTVGSRIPPARGYFLERHHAELKQLEAGELQKLLGTLSEEDRARYLELDGLRKDIQRQVAQNPSLAMDLVAGELDKLDALLGTFMHLANSSERYQDYIKASDLNALEADVRRQETVVEKTSDPEARDLARKNLFVLEKRLEKAVDVRKHLRTVRAQLNLIENTLKLLRDQIVTMSSPKELSGQLEDLTTAIDTIEATDRETEAIMRGLDRELAVRQ